MLKIVKQKKRNRLFVFNTQDTPVPTETRLTQEGFIEDSMLNLADSQFASKLSRAVEDCLVNQNVSNILSTLLGDPTHMTMQTMFFDKFTGTIEHQDPYFFDAAPSGSIVAA